MAIPCDKERVLIVDDEQSILRLFRMILSFELPDIKIDVASNGAKALEAFNTGHHAVLLMDLHMPVMDGPTAFLEIQNVCKEKDWDTPSVVFCTGFAPPETIKNAVSENSAHCLLLKPVSTGTLVEAVKNRLTS